MELFKIYLYILDHIYAPKIVSFSVYHNNSHRKTAIKNIVRKDASYFI